MTADYARPVHPTTFNHEPVYKQHREGVTDVMSSILPVDGDHIHVTDPPDERTPAGDEEFVAGRSLFPFGCP
ncbi:hypothetical protein [Nocardia sp. X0981]